MADFPRGSFSLRIGLIDDQPGDRKSLGQTRSPRHTTGSCHTGAQIRRLKCRFSKAAKWRLDWGKRRRESRRFGILSGCSRVCPGRFQKKKLPFPSHRTARTECIDTTCFENKAKSTVRRKCFAFL